MEKIFNKKLIKTNSSEPIKIIHHISDEEIIFSTTNLYSYRGSVVLLVDNSSIVFIKPDNFVCVYDKIVKQHLYLVNMRKSEFRPYTYRNPAKNCKFDFPHVFEYFVGCATMLDKSKHDYILKDFEMDKLVIDYTQTVEGRLESAPSRDKIVENFFEGIRVSYKTTKSKKWFSIHGTKLDGPYKDIILVDKDRIVKYKNKLVFVVNEELYMPINESQILKVESDCGYKMYMLKFTFDKSSLKKFDKKLNSLRGLPLAKSSDIQDWLSTQHEAWGSAQFKMTSFDTFEFN